MTWGENASGKSQFSNMTLQERLDAKKIDLDSLANTFCELDDEGQAEFFIRVAAIASKWESRQHQQWWAVGRHLRDCDCSNDTARDMLFTIAQGLKRV